MNSDTGTNDARIQPFIEQLYEGEGLTDYLTDDDARTLLEWGEQELNNLTGLNIEESALEDTFHLLRRIIRSINRTVGQKTELSDQRMVRRLLRIVENSIEFSTRKPITERNNHDKETEEK